MSSPKFKKCCCTGGASGCRFTTASASGTGFTPLDGSWDDGNNYLVLTAVNKMELIDGATWVGVTGSITIDAKTGKVVSQSISDPPAPNSLASPGSWWGYFGGDPHPPDGATPTHAEWTYPSPPPPGDLSDPVQTVDISTVQTISDLNGYCDDLLTAAETLGLSNAHWIVNYIGTGTGLSRLQAEAVVPTWVLDPHWTGDPSAVPYVKAWVGIYSGTLTYFDDIAAAGAATVQSTLQSAFGPCAISFPETPSDLNSPACNFDYNIPAPSISRVDKSSYVVTGLTPSSIHCVHVVPDSDMLSNGNTVHCFEVDADTSGKLRVIPDSIIIGPSHQGHIYYWVWLYFHPTTGGDGCPCVADM